MELCVVVVVVEELIRLSTCQICRAGRRSGKQHEKKENERLKKIYI